MLAGRPFHLNPEFNLAIPEMICDYGFFSCLPRTVCLLQIGKKVFSAETIGCIIRGCIRQPVQSERQDLELVQRNSFGCGLDASTKDRLRSMPESRGKLYTVLRIDEINNLGAARIRIRSLIAAMNQRRDAR